MSDREHKLLSEPQQPQLFFLHIPKTAGSSVRHFFMDALDPSEVFLAGDRGPAFEDFSTAQLRRYRVIGGHIPFHHAHWGLTDRKNRLPNPMRALRRPKRVYCAVLREPESFVRSNFNYVNRHPGHAWKTKGSLHAAIANKEKFAKRLRNLQCYYLSGVRSSRAALRNIRKYPFIIGTFDRLDLFTAELQERLGTEAELPHMNASPKRQTKANESVPGLERLVEEDRELYAFVREHGLYISPAARL